VHSGIGVVDLPSSITKAATLERQRRPSLTQFLNSMSRLQERDLFPSPDLIYDRSTFRRESTCCNSNSN
jgi:hypothetical protein